MNIPKHIHSEIEQSVLETSYVVESPTVEVYSFFGDNVYIQGVLLKGGTIEDLARATINKPIKFKS